MSVSRPMFSVCIPAYNRSQYLAPLLDSIYMQDFKDFQIVICEDCSKERTEIARIARIYSDRYPGTLEFIENRQNLGYDANIRNLVAQAKGKYCFFMGNDDLMCEGALATASSIFERYKNAGLILKSYSWFDESPERINQEIRYFTEEQLFSAGKNAIAVCFRRSGVISGYIVHRDAAHEAATEKFDGTLYYQMHLTASVLCKKDAIATPKILVLCRNSELPDFGNSDKEKDKYTPGRYTPTARLSMIAGALSILRNLKSERKIDVVAEVMQDYANYFYPYIKDQLTLPLADYYGLCKGYASIGFYKYPMFYLYCVAAYILGEKRFDFVTKRVRSYLGRSPHFGL